MPLACGSSALQSPCLSMSLCVNMLVNIEARLSTVHPTSRVNSCIAIDRLMIELLEFHIPFLSFPNAGFKGYGKNLLNRRLRITQLP